jgi:hypothetical protein
MAIFFCESRENDGALIVTPKNSRDNFKSYEKLKVGKSGFLWGYWNAGKNTKSGFYRDAIIYVGSDHQKSEIVQVSEREIKITRRAD